MCKKKSIQKAKPTKDGFNEPKQMHSDTPVYKVAVILDGQVQDVIRTEARMAAMLLSDPIFVDISNMDPQPGINTRYSEEKGEFLPDHEENHI